MDMKRCKGPLNSHLKKKLQSMVMYMLHLYLKCSLAENASLTYSKLLTSYITFSGIIIETPEIQHSICSEQHSAVFKDDGDLNVSHFTDSASGHSMGHLESPIATSFIQKSDLKNVYPSHRNIYHAKLALNSGREHTTPKGKVRQPRQVRPPCSDKCKRCQSPKMSHAERLSVNEEFWNLGSHLEQWKLIVKLLNVSSPKNKFAIKGSKGEKLCSRSYFFNLNGEPRKVCKTMFKNTLSICDSWIDSAISHCFGSSMKQDQRGRHSNRPKRKHKSSFTKILSALST